LPEVAPAAVSVGRRLSPVAHFLLAFLFGLLLVAQNYIEWWADGLAGVLYWVMAVSATLLLTIIVLCLLLAHVALRATGRRNPSISDLLRYLPIWLLALLMAGMLAWVTRPALGVGSDTMEFNSAVWRAGNSHIVDRSELSPRQRMLKGAMAAIQPAKSRAEIEALLGPSLDPRIFSHVDPDLLYSLGRGRGAMAMGEEFLLIWLDGSGKMVRYQLVAD
jgi:hypothetical protein